jgi:beta-barrel assembly-enhancing protease
MRGRIFSWLGLGIMALTLGGLFPGVPAFYVGMPLYAITLEEEQKLGEQVVREVEARFTMVRDPLLLNYLNRIGQETLQKAGPLPYPFRFYLLKDPQLNAFSVPGGHIFVTTGILEVMDSEGELAGLLGHEIAHVTSHHIAKRMEREKKIGLATMAAVLASIFAGDPRIASAVITSSLATGISLSLKYSREDEEEADNYGFKTMTRAGFNPGEMSDLLIKLRKWGSLGYEGMPPYLLTHPGIGDRIAQIESLQKKYEAQGPWLRASSEDFRRFQILILAQYGDPQRAKNRFQQLDKEGTSPLWIHYGMGWVNLREKNLDGAVSEFQTALSLKPHDPYVLRDLGQTYLQKRDLNAAIQNLSQASLMNPRDSNAAFFLGRAYLEKGDNLLALENFQRALNMGAGDEEIFQYLGKVYGNLGDLGAAHYNLGRFFQRRGETNKAVFHYKTALKNLDKNPELKTTVEKEIKKLTPSKEENPKPIPENKKGPGFRPGPAFRG